MRPSTGSGLALSPVGERPPVELLSFAGDDRVELRLTHSDQLQVLAADDPDAPLRDRSDAVLGLEWRPELADKQDVERRFQRPGDLVADRDAASRERQYQRILGPEPIESRGELAPGVSPIGEQCQSISHGRRT